MRKAVHHLRRPFAIKRTWAGFPAFSPPAVFDGTPRPDGREIRTKQSFKGGIWQAEFRGKIYYPSVA
jgi:hypothetical protein